MPSHSVTQCFPRCVSLPCSACVSICHHTVSRSVSRAASPCPALPASQYALTLCHAVFPALRLPALLCLRLNMPSHCHAVSRAASPCPASQCAPGLNLAQEKDMVRRW